MELTTGQFNDSYIPIMDGVSVTVRNYAYWLNRILGPSSVVTPRFPGYQDRDHFPVHRYFSLPVPMRPPYRLGLPHLDVPFQLRLKRQPFHLVHCHSPFSAATLAMNIATKRRIPIVASLHSKYKDDLEQALRIPILVRHRLKRIVHFLNSVDEVWIPTDSFVETVREYGYTGTVHVVPNGVDIDPPSEADIRDLRQKGNTYLQTGDHQTVFLYVGQLIWQKNLKLLLSALNHLKKEGNNFVMVIIGEGYARRRLMALATDLNLQSVVRFPGAIKDRQELKAYYARADLFLFPSLYDVAPLVVREAAAFRLPAVFLQGATAARGVLDMKNGFVSGHSSEQLAATISRLIHNRDVIRNAGEGAMNLLYKSWQDVLNEVKDRYVSIVRSHSPS